MPGRERKRWNRTKIAMKFSWRGRFGTFCRRNANKRRARHERKLDVIAKGGVMMKQKEKLGLIQQHQRRSDRESEGKKTEPLFGKNQCRMKSRLRARRRAQTCFWLWKARDGDLTREPRRRVSMRTWRSTGRRARLQGERQKAEIRTTSVWRKLVSDQPKIKSAKLP